MDPEMTMTDERMALIELIEKGADSSDLVREFPAFCGRTDDGAGGRGEDGSARGRVQSRSRQSPQTP